MELDYPWTRPPVVVSAPMRLISLSSLAIAVSRAGGIGFIGAGTDLSGLRDELRLAHEAFVGSEPSSQHPGVLPIGVGFINWGLSLDEVIEAFGDYVPAAVWFFAPEKSHHLVEWTKRIRETSQGRTKIWVQVCTVADAIEIADLCHPDVFVVQGSDAGGHSLAQSASIISLLPEVSDALGARGHGSIRLVAAGGIVEGRGAAAAFALGAQGICMGTRFLASLEAIITEGYQNDVIRTKDGGTTTARTKVYDQLRGTTGWPEQFNGRGITNRSFSDAIAGMPMEQNKRLYEEAMQDQDGGWGLHGRLTSYAGTGVGLIEKVLSAEEIVEEIRASTTDIQLSCARGLSKL